MGNMLSNIVRPSLHYIIYRDIRYIQDNMILYKIDKHDIMTEALYSLNDNVIDTIKHINGYRNLINFYNDEISKIDNYMRTNILFVKSNEKQNMHFKMYINKIFYNYSHITQLQQLNYLKKCTAYFHERTIEIPHTAVHSVFNESESSDSATREFINKIKYDLIIRKNNTRKYKTNIK